MPPRDHFRVLELATLHWPSLLPIPSRRFRLFVAADVTAISTEVISEFAYTALKSGMVYFCSWGPDCSRFHDIVDEVIVEDDLGERLFVSSNEDDVVMTTWHEKDHLEEALDFFINWAYPDGNFADDSDHWLAISLNNSEWAESIRRKIEAAEGR
jgi:hypothetical protein